ncbi:unnamed protein product [Phytomonas sp. Hart1]|nr:unnamed protein product [Phytomonas sp. Hart1]|eukprot:CCW68819.1 unnamed protein product [Phytomonas sp. isolate Hart1]
MDAVVRNHYVRRPTPPVTVQLFQNNSPNLSSAVSVDNEIMSNVNKGNMVPPSSAAVFFSGMRLRLHRFMLLFSNETHNVDTYFLDNQRFTRREGGNLTESSSPNFLKKINSDYRSCNDDLQDIRIIANEAASPNFGAHHHHQANAKLNETGNQVGVLNNNLSSENVPPKQDLVASAGWPPHTEKYVSLSLEPSQSISGVYSEINDARTVSDALRHLADRSTHQSLVRCAPFSAIPGTNCEADPSYLGADYLRLMLSAFLLLPSSIPPLRVGVLGLGGGSLPLFLLHYFSRSIHHLDLVEVEPMCIRAAVQDLGFWDTLNQHELALGSPKASEDGFSSGSPTTQVHLEDAIVFLQKHHDQIADLSPPRSDHLMTGRPIATTQEPLACGSPVSSSFVPTSKIVDRGKLSNMSSCPLLPSFSPRSRERLFDLLFVDLFLGSDLTDGVASADFLRLCRASLSSCGVVAFNLPARDRPFLQQCRQIFGEANTYLLMNSSSSNVVVLARGGSVSAFAREGLKKGGVDGSVPAPHLSHRMLYRRAMELSERHQLPFDLSAHYPVWWRFW